jgi:hypothetical protein
MGLDARIAVIAAAFASIHCCHRLGHEEVAEQCKR